ncbi:MAG: AraC family transcriptional regulator [Verrucomicrobiota bacterium]
MKENLLKISIPLEHPPQIVSIGQAMHGRRRRERYHFTDYWHVHLYFYALEIEYGDIRLEIPNGSLTILPPGKRMVYHYPRRDCEHLYICFALTESKYTGQGKLHYQSQELPAPTTKAFRSACLHAGQRPYHATAFLWQLLCTLTHSPDTLQYSPHPLVNKACLKIHAQLNQNLYVEELARDLGVSHNHLTRQFKRSLGQTVIEYIQEKRMLRAKELLQNTTLPVKVIAHECGVFDPHVFNKMVRRYHGVPPRSLR